MHLILFGFPACGKSSLGRTLAEQLQRPFIDSDQCITEAGGAPIPHLYKNLGETDFRALEKRVLFSLPLDPPSVIALGGGSVLDPENVRFLRTIGWLIYLDLPFEELYQRLSQRGFPIYIDAIDPRSSLEQLYKTRKPIYEAIAHGH